MSLCTLGIAPVLAVGTSLQEDLLTWDSLELEDCAKLNDLGRLRIEEYVDGWEDVKEQEEEERLCVALIAPVPLLAAPVPLLAAPVLELPAMVQELPMLVKHKYET